MFSWPQVLRAWAGQDGGLGWTRSPTVTECKQGCVVGPLVIVTGRAVLRESRTVSWLQPAALHPTPVGTLHKASGSAIPARQDGRLRGGSRAQLQPGLPSPFHPSLHSLALGEHGGGVQAAAPGWNGEAACCLQLEYSLPSSAPFLLPASGLMSSLHLGACLQA